MLSLHLAMNGFGQFFTVYVLKGLRMVFGYKSIGNDWLGAGVLILVLCCISIGTFYYDEILAWDGIKHGGMVAAPLV